MKKETDFGHGVIRRNPIIKTIEKLSRQLQGQKIAKAGIPFDWVKGYDVRNTIGPIQIKNQGGSYSCGGQAGSYFVEIQRKLQNIKEGSLSAKSMYSPWQNLGGGMTVTQLNTQIGAHGANLEVTVPSYDAYGQPLTEIMFNDLSWETKDALADAYKRTGYTPFDLFIYMETVAETVRDYGAVIIEIQGNNNGTWLSPTPSIVKVSNYWYHYLCVVGAKTFGPDKKLIVLNSWGDIGDHGVQYLGEEWFTSGNIIDAFTFIHDTQIVPIPKVKLTVWQQIWANVNLWFRQQQGLKLA